MVQVMFNMCNTDLTYMVRTKLSLSNFAVPSKFIFGKNENGEN
jgi:hypothetical protein